MLVGSVHLSPKSLKKVLSNKKSPLRAILFGGSIAGAIDIGAASLINATSVSVILKAFASGAMTADAFIKGLPDLVAPSARDSAAPVGAIWTPVPRFRCA